MTQSHGSVPEEKNRHGNGEKDDGGDPPDYLYSRRFWSLGKLTLDEFIVIETVVRQIEAVGRIDSPAGIMVGPAFGAGEGAAWHVFAADGADLGCLEPGFSIAVDIPIEAENGDLEIAAPCCLNSASAGHEMRA